MDGLNQHCLIHGTFKDYPIPLPSGPIGSQESVVIEAIAQNKAELADKLKEKVATSLSAFDDARVQYQMSQVMVRRHIVRFQIYQMRYVRGASSTEDFLQQQNEMDRSKTQVYDAWAKLRRTLFDLKLLALAQKTEDD